jgi:hypothetical protein
MLLIMHKKICINFFLIFSGFLKKIVKKLLSKLFKKTRKNLKIIKNYLAALTK